MNKGYEEGRKPFFSESGETQRKQYVWAKDKESKEYLQETESIDIQAEIESYADECDIKNIVCDVMTDKALVQIPAKSAGKVVKLYTAKGQIAKVHAPLFAIRRVS